MCDASSYDRSSLISCQMVLSNPIGFASRSLSVAQRNYSQLEKEALAIVFGVQHFHSYLVGHYFDSVTDHKPLLALLHEHRVTSAQASAR